MKKSRFVIKIVMLPTISAILAVLYGGGYNYKGEQIKIESEPHSERTAPCDVVPTIEEIQIDTSMTPEQLAEEEYFDSLEVLACCVEAESGNQDLIGKQLVVDVVLNRVDSDRFPNDIVSVITQGEQFTTWENGQIEMIEPSEETYLAVKLELESRSNSEVLFFTAGRYNPYCIPLFKHGDHYFGK